MARVPSRMRKVHPPLPSAAAARRAGAPRGFARHLLTRRLRLPVAGRPPLPLFCVPVAMIAPASLASLLFPPLRARRCRRLVARRRPVTTAAAAVSRVKEFVVPVWKKFVCQLGASGWPRRPRRPRLRVDSRRGGVVDSPTEWWGRGGRDDGVRAPRVEASTLHHVINTKSYTTSANRLDRAVLGLE